MEIEEKEESLNDTMKKISRKLDEMTKTKDKKMGFKIPFKAKLSKGNIKKNYVSVMLLKENRDVDFIKAPISNGCIDIDGIPRISTTDFILNYKNKPLMILPSWSIKPFSPEENYQKTVTDNVTTAGIKLIIEKIERNAIENKKKGFSFIWWIIIIIVLAGAGYYLFKGGKLF